MRGTRWVWLALICGGCNHERPPAPEPDVGVHAAVDASVVRLGPPAPKPCVVWHGDAGGCGAGMIVFDGTACRPACEPLDAGDVRGFTNELACVVSCQCDLSKFAYPFDAELRCDELWLFTQGPIDWDAGTCEVAPGSTRCTAWMATDGYGVGGSPLQEDGVRLACAASLKSQVSSVCCFTMGE